MRKRLQPFMMRVSAAVFLSFFLIACVDIVHNYSRAQQQGIPAGLYTQGVNFTDFVVSPDGSQIAFEYVNAATGRGVIGLGLYELKTGKTTRIPTPAGKQFSMPSFSPDGKHLLVAESNRGAVTGKQIAEVDLKTMKAKEITSPAEDSVYYPIYQPGTGNILYWSYWKYLTFELYLLNPNTHTQQKLGPRHVSVSRPFFVGQNDIIYQGHPGGSEVPEVQEATNYAGLVTYRFRIGGKPQVVSAEAERNRGVTNPEAFTSMSASRDGSVLAYIRRKDREKGVTRVMHNLYASSNGSVTQLTDLKSYIVRPFMSADASIIVFGADIAQPKIIDIYVYDMKTGTVSPTNLLQHISNNPAFTLN